MVNKKKLAELQVKNFGYAEKIRILATRELISIDANISTKAFKKFNKELLENQIIIGRRIISKDDLREVIDEINTRFYTEKTGTR